MKKFLSALVSVSCLSLNTAGANAAISDRTDEASYSPLFPEHPHGSSADDLSAATDEPQTAYSSPIFPDAGKYSLYVHPSRRKAVGFYFDVKKPAISDMIDERSFLADNEALRPVPWKHGFDVNDQGFMLGYRWKRLSIESATQQAVGRNAENALAQQRSALRSNWRSTRLSFSPAENWLIRLSRGAVSNLDNLVPGEQVRRTALAATYSLPFTGGGWQATFAWGRNARKNRESHSGYLIESSVRFAGVHSMFGRIEQVGSDSLMRENESLQRQLFNLNRLTLGYYQDLRIHGPVGLDVGAFVSRHLVPSQMTASYGKNPSAYMMFIRFKLQ